MSSELQVVLSVVLRGCYEWVGMARGCYGWVDIEKVYYEWVGIERVCRHLADLYA